MTPRFIRSGEIGSRGSTLPRRLRCLRSGLPNRSFNDGHWTNTKSPMRSLRPNLEFGAIDHLSRSCTIFGRENSRRSTFEHSTMMAAPQELWGCWLRVEIHQISVGVTEVERPASPGLCCRRFDPGFHNWKQSSELLVNITNPELQHHSPIVSRDRGAGNVSILSLSRKDR